MTGHPESSKFLNEWGLKLKIEPRILDVEFLKVPEMIVSRKREIKLNSVICPLDARTFDR